MPRISTNASKQNMVWCPVNTVKNKYHFNMIFFTVPLPYFTILIPCCIVCNCVPLIEYIEDIVAFVSEELLTVSIPVVYVFMQFSTHDMKLSEAVPVSSASVCPSPHIVSKSTLFTPL